MEVFGKHKPTGKTLTKPGKKRTRPDKKWGKSTPNLILNNRTINSVKSGSPHSVKI